MKKTLNQTKTIEQAEPAFLLSALCGFALGLAEKELQRQGKQTRDIWGDRTLEDRCIRLLSARMEYLFRENESFRKGVLSRRNGGNAGRDYLRMFAVHWGLSIMDARPTGRTLWDYEKTGEGLLFIEEQTLTFGQ